MENLIAGAFDMHVHSGPDVQPRKVDDLELAQRIVDAKMNGYIIKSHYFNTAERAALVRKAIPGCNVQGALSLNSAIGGLNPLAVQLAVMSGIKLIWFPTSDARHEQERMFGGNAPPPEKLPLWAKVAADLHSKNIEYPSVYILDERGSLKEKARDILKIAGQNDIIVATGHLSHEETFAAARAAKECGVNKLVITHASFPTTCYTVEEQKEFLNCGAYIEHCYSNYATGKVQFELVLSHIRAIGAQHVVISSDLGQPKNVFPDEGLLKFSQDLLANGFSEKEVKMMNGDNPRMLVDAD
jgi:hypothetical protein